jgi:hypothetical protein
MRPRVEAELLAGRHRFPYNSRVRYTDPNTQSNSPSAANLPGPYVSSTQNHCCCDSSHRSPMA